MPKLSWQIHIKSILKYCISVVCVFFYTQKIAAQNPDSLKNRPLMVISGDSLKKDILKDKKTTEKFKIDPKVATRKSAILPGAGQIYIKQYWFLPAIYGGLVANTVFVSKWQKNYKAFRTEYFRVSTYNDNLPKGEVALAKGKVTIGGVTKDYTIDVLKQGTNVYRRYRDLTLMLYPVIWAVNVLEVNVSAHLRTFDMSDDISLKLSPLLNTDLAGNYTMGASFKLNF
jgi:hypothetical protein